MNAMTAELLQPIADEDVEHVRRGPRAHLLLLNGVLDPRDGLWSGVWLSGCIRVAEMRCGRHLVEGRKRKARAEGKSAEWQKRESVEQLTPTSCCARCGGAGTSARE